MDITTCSKCNRAVRVEDVDSDGRCCFCEDKEPKGKRKLTKFHPSGDEPDVADD